MGGPYFIYVIVGAVLLTIVLIVIMVLGAIRRWYTPARPKIKKTYVVRKNVTPMTYRPAPSERCEITIENCCNMEYCDTVRGSTVDGSGIIKLTIDFYSSPASIQRSWSRTGRRMMDRRHDPPRTTSETCSATSCWTTTVTSSKALLSLVWWA